MPKKEAILENVDMYSAEELAGYINDGIVTFDELCDNTDGNFAKSVRDEVRKLLALGEENDWKKAKSSNDIQELDDYLKKYQNGSHRAEARSLISQLEQEMALTEAENAWNSVDKNSISALESFCRTYPENSHYEEGRKKISELSNEELFGDSVEVLLQTIKSLQADNEVLNPDQAIYNKIVDSLDNNKITRNDLLQILEEDNNILRGYVVKKLCDNDYLNIQDLKLIGINPLFVRALITGEGNQTFGMPTRLEKINFQSTEVYFWGIPSSGKTCALGAILSMAESGRVAKTMIKNNNCQGYGYMTRLSALFGSNNTVCKLPASTSIYATYEMGCSLVDDKDKSHPLTFIDLAGELIRCMYKSDAKEPLSQDEIDSLDTLTSILIDNRTQNRKIHFFVLEYGADDRKYEGLTQKAYLDGALRYIDRTGIFKKETDAIYLMITKVDKAKARGSQLGDILKEYINGSYKSFYNGLKKICKDSEINGGEVPILPFSLGQVCFQDYCLFDENAASNIVRILIDRSKGFGTGKWSIFFKGMKG